MGTLICLPKNNTGRFFFKNTLSPYESYKNVFALLQGKNEDILFHGTHYHCELKTELMNLLINGQYTIYAHTHVDGGKLIASSDDRNFLKAIGIEYCKKYEENACSSWSEHDGKMFCSVGIDDVLFIPERKLKDQSA